MPSSPHDEGRSHVTRSSLDGAGRTSELKRWSAAQQSGDCAAMAMATSVSCGRGRRDGHLSLVRRALRPKRHGLLAPTQVPAASVHTTARCKHPSTNMAAQKQHTVFLHPDLGIGGAERLVIDAAVALQRRGHTVTIFTSHCDPQHCFDEARDGKPRPRLTTTHRSCTDTAA